MSKHFLMMFLIQVNFNYNLTNTVGHRLSEQVETEGSSDHQFAYQI